MSLVFRYQGRLSRHPLITLRGATVRYRPIHPITVLGPGGGHAIDALADTGADDIVFPEWVAGRIGLDLTNAPVGESTGINQGILSVRYAEVGLRLWNPHEQREWRAWVAFTSAPLRHGYFGQAGGLEFFEAAFRSWRLELELTVAPTYPGT
jgi:hypothetical protein